MWIDEKQPDETMSEDKPAETADNAQNAQPAQPAQPEQPGQPPVQNAQPTQPTQAPVDAPRPRRRGFAAMDRDRVKQIASKGGRAAHAAGTAHQFSSDEARVAGKKGGMAPHVRRGGVRRRPSTENIQPGPISQNHGDGR